MTLVFNIPATLQGYSPIDVRIEFPDGRYTFNFFYNITAITNPNHPVQCGRMLCPLRESLPSRSITWSLISWT